MKSRMLLLLIMLLSSVALVQSQTYEVRAVNKGNGYVSVEMRATSVAAPATADYVTDMVFGLKWLASYHVDLQNTITTSYNIVKSDVRKTKGMYYYQAFSASTTPFTFPANWTLNNWVEIMSVRNTQTGNGVGTFEVTEVGFDITTEPNFGVSLTDFTPAVASSATLVSLPVNLTSFEAVAKKGVIMVEWTTSGEQNAKGFEIERAEESSPASFKNIGWTNSKGSADGKYEFADGNVLANIKYYYRLKQVDINEKFRYSEIRVASLNEPGNNAIQLWPNPVEKMLQVSFDGTIETGKVLIKVTDGRGAVILQKSHDLSTNRKAELSVVTLANGQYILSVENNKGLLYAKPFLKK
jgi:hypothetical protein